jgi:hypothetical protein
MPESIDIYGLKNPTPVLVEFYFNQPTVKTKAKQIVFTLLTSLNINDEFDISSISYLTETHANSVQKIVIQFKYSSGNYFI